MVVKGSDCEDPVETMSAVLATLGGSGRVRRDIGVDQNTAWSTDEVRQFAGKAYAAGQKLAGAAGWSNPGATQT